jgi:tetratricopeptide (TPR) repeat protein
MSESKLENSLREFKQELLIRESLSNNKIEIARVNRMIGEVLMLKGKYSEAHKHEQVYLKLAKDCSDLVEQQRAYATIGRCHLLRAEDESVGGSDNVNNDYKAAEKAFLKSLIICKE